MLRADAPVEEMKMGKEAQTMSRELLAWFLAGLFAGVLISRPPDRAAAQLPTSAAGVAPQTAATGRVFQSDAGLMLKFVRPDKVTDFEATLNKLKEAFDRTDNPVRRRQAAGWRIFRAAEMSMNGDLVYVFEIDPAVRDADYTVSTILAEAFPSEAQSLYRRYAESYATDQNVINLKLIAALGNSPR